MLQYLIKWQGYPESDNTWEPADQVYALYLLQEYHKHQPLESIKGKQKPPAKTTICTISSSLTSPIIASQWTPLLPHYQSSSPATSQRSSSLSLISLSTPPCTPTPYPQTRSPSPGPSTISRPMPSGTDPSLPTQSRVSLQDTRISLPPSYRHLLLVSPPQYNRERLYITVRLPTSRNTWPMSTQSVELSNSIYRTLMESRCCALMDMRTIMEDSPYLLSPVQMGAILLSSSRNCTMEEWQDLALWQEVSMMLVSSTYLLHWPLINNHSNPSLTGSMLTSGVTPLTSTPSMRPSSPSTTGGSLPRSSNTESWTERLLHYRWNLAWWMQTLQHLSWPNRPTRTILSLHEWQRRLSHWGSSISNCR